MSSLALSVDLGGTNLRIGVVDAEGNVLEVRSLPSIKEGRELLAYLGDSFEKIEKDLSRRGEKIGGIALGFPGIVNSEEGVVYQSPHFPDWDHFEVLPYFRKRFSCPIVLENDANLIALGELWKGAGRGLESFLLLTLGTGVGGAIVIRKQLFRGDSGFAGELGHVVVEKEGFHCHCGGRGCLEMYVSATGIREMIGHSTDDEGRRGLLKKIGQDLEHLSIQKLYEATLEGDSFGHLIFREMGHSLGVGIASLVNAFGIFNILIGGGVSAASDFFLPAVGKEVTSRTYRETAKRIRVAKCELGDKAGLIGGAAIVNAVWK